MRADDVLISTRREWSGGSTSRQEGLVSIIACSNAQITTAGLVPVGLWRLRKSTSHSGPAARAQSCLTQAGHRPVVWPHEIPDSGISHRNAGSSPRSGTEEGDISPVFPALEHAAGDFTTLGKNPLLEYSSPPSDTQTGEISPKPDITRTRSPAACWPGRPAPPRGEAAMTAPLIAPLIPRAPGRAAASTAGRARPAACPSPPRRKSRRSRMT